MFFYRFLRGSVDQWLSLNHLLYQKEVACDTTIHSLITLVATDMTNSPMGYRFSNAVMPNHLRHENLPLALLALVSRGQARPRDQQIRLSLYPVDPAFTIGQLSSDRSRFASPLFIHDGHLSIHFSKSPDSIFMKSYLYLMVFSRQCIPSRISRGWCCTSLLVTSSVS